MWIFQATFFVKAAYTATCPASVPCRETSWRAIPVYLHKQYLRDNRATKVQALSDTPASKTKFCAVLDTSVSNGSAIYET